MPIRLVGINTNIFLKNALEEQNPRIIVILDVAQSFGKTITKIYHYNKRDLVGPDAWVIPFAIPPFSIKSSALNQCSPMKSDPGLVFLCSTVHHSHVLSFPPPLHRTVSPSLEPSGLICVIFHFIMICNQVHLSCSPSTTQTQFFAIKGLGLSEKLCLYPRCDYFSLHTVRSIS